MNKCGHTLWLANTLIAFKLTCFGFCVVDFFQPPHAFLVVAAGLLVASTATLAALAEVADETSGVSGVGLLISVFSRSAITIFLRVFCGRGEKHIAHVFAP